MPRDRTIHIPLAQGMQTKADPRALQLPALSVCLNAEFDELGGLQKRKPYSPTSGLTNVRKIVSHGEELLVFTKDALYTRGGDVGQTWTSKATYLAPKISEKSLFTKPTEQYECDRAELSDVIVYAWSEPTASYIAAIKKSTGAVIYGPSVYSPAGGGDATRHRLLALDTVIMYVFQNSAVGLVALPIDPADVSGSLADTPTTLLAGASYGGEFDACPVPTEDACLVAAQGIPSTSYYLRRVTAAMGVTTSTKARTCDGPIAIAATGGASAPGQRAAVIRANGTSILGDIVNSTSLGDFSSGAAVGTATGTPVNQIAAAFKSTQDSSQYRCHTFWSAEQASTDASFLCETNWVDTAGSVGTESTLVRRAGVASRAFGHDGRVFVWVVFAGSSTAGGMGEPLGLRAQLQNTFYLYRDDGLLVAKAAMNRAGGFSATTGHLPQVQNTASNVYTWCGTERRVIPLGDRHRGYSDRGPRDITVEFDSNEARRTARLGDTIYVSGGQILQYDGTGLTELGFHVYPWYFAVTDGGAASASYTPAGKTGGTVAYKCTYRSENRKGELDRSTTASGTSLSIVAGNKAAIGSTVPLHITLKESVAVEYWATTSNAPIDSPFYLVTSKDPTDTTNPNRYLANVTTSATLSTVDDEYRDDKAAVTDTNPGLIRQETNPENGGVLENLAPPPATIVLAEQERLFLAGIADAPNAVWYSKTRNSGEVASFHDALAVELPPAGGAITALAYLNETLVVFKRNAIYMLPGDGFDNVAQGSNFGPPRLLTLDLGALSQESIGVIPQGLLFKSDKGWYLLNRGWTTEYVGAPIATYDSETVVGVNVLESKHQVRCLTSSRLLVWDYLVNQWSEHTPITGGVSSCLWNRVYYYASSSNVYAELSSFSVDTDYSLDVETPWIKLADMQGLHRVSYIMVLGEYRSAHRVRVRVARDYQESDASGITWFDDKIWTVSPTTVGGPLQVRHGPSIQQGEAMKIRITDVDTGDTSGPAGEGYKLTGLALSYKVKPGLYKFLPPAQKQ